MRGTKCPLSTDFPFSRQACACFVPVGAMGQSARRAFRGAVCGTAAVTIHHGPSTGQGRSPSTVLVWSMMRHSESGAVRGQPLIGQRLFRLKSLQPLLVKKGTCQRRAVTAPFLQEIWYDIKRKGSSVVRRCRHHVQTSANLRKPALCGIVHMLRAFLLLILRCCPACPCMQAGSCRAKTADRRRHLPDRQFGYCLSACRSGRSGRLLARMMSAGIVFAARIMFPPVAGRSVRHRKARTQGFGPSEMVMDRMHLVHHFYPVHCARSGALFCNS